METGRTGRGIADDGTVSVQHDGNRDARRIAFVARRSFLICRNAYAHHCGIIFSRKVTPRHFIYGRNARGRHRLLTQRLADRKESCGARLNVTASHRERSGYGGVRGGEGSAGENSEEFRVRRARRDVRPRPRVSSDRIGRVFLFFSPLLSFSFFFFFFFFFLFFFLFFLPQRDNRARACARVVEIRR